MRLIEFVKLLPANWVLAPIYRKGARMRSGKEATGKNPLEVSFDRQLKSSDVALQLEKNENLGAVGLFTGHRGRGMVILDVDMPISPVLSASGVTPSRVRRLPLALRRMRRNLSSTFRRSSGVRSVVLGMARITTLVTRCCGVRRG